MPRKRFSYNKNVARDVKHVLILYNKVQTESMFGQAILEYISPYNYLGIKNIAGNIKKISREILKDT